MKYKRIIALISDTHTGSKYALFPPSWKDSEGNEHKANPGQLQIYEAWESFAETCDEMDVDTVIHLGDALHGLNRKQFGLGLMMPDLNQQKDVCVELLKPLVGGRDFFCLSGSGYHESLDWKQHESICKELKPYARRSKFLGPLANLEITGTSRIMNVAHGESGAAIYRTTVMDREGTLLLQAEAEGKLPHFDIIARGHWHFFLHLHLAHQHLIQVPCWMAWEPSRPYLRYYGKMQPHIGGVIVRIDQQDRIDPMHFLYKAPHIGDCLQKI
jgi:predicted phosphodiesterase